MARIKLQKEDDGSPDIQHDAMRPSFRESCELPAQQLSIVGRRMYEGRLLSCMCIASSGHFNYENAVDIAEQIHTCAALVLYPCITAYACHEHCAIFESGLYFSCNRKGE